MRAKYWLVFVIRNSNPNNENFMFQLTEKEVEDMVSQNAIPLKQVLGGALPYAFTEHEQQQ
ncbi:ORF6N domain-containing protein [Solitalea agri]